MHFSEFLPIVLIESHDRVDKILAINLFVLLATHNKEEEDTTHQNRSDKLHLYSMRHRQRERIQGLQPELLRVAIP